MPARRQQKKRGTRQNTRQQRTLGHIAPSKAAAGTSPLTQQMGRFARRQLHSRVCRTGKDLRTRDKSLTTFVTGGLFRREGSCNANPIGVVLRAMLADIARCLTTFRRAQARPPSLARVRLLYRSR